MRLSGRNLRQTEASLGAWWQRMASNEVGLVEPVRSVPAARGIEPLGPGLGRGVIVAPGRMPAGVDWVKVAGDWSREVGIEWPRTRAIEIVEREPMLSKAFVDWQAREFLTLARLPGRLERWASRFPQARFFVGPVSTFAVLTAGRFDWASMLDRPIEGRTLQGELPHLARLLRKKGCLLLRAPAQSAELWNKTAGWHDRWQLRVVGTQMLEDGSQLIVSRRW